jgi:hypothetical protein
MKYFAIVVLLSACAHNYADAFAAAVFPGADRVPIGQQGVLVVSDSFATVCRASAAHDTVCKPIANWSQPGSQPQAVRPKTAAPADAETPPHSPPVPNPQPMGPAPIGTSPAVPSAPK